MVPSDTIRNRLLAVIVAMMGIAALRWSYPVTMPLVAAVFVIAARAVGVDVSLPGLVPLGLVVLQVSAIPLGVAGWGPREGGAARGWCGVPAPPTGVRRLAAPPVPADDADRDGSPGVAARREHDGDGAVCGGRCVGHVQPKAGVHLSPVGGSA